MINWLVVQISAAVNGNVDLNQIHGSNQTIDWYLSKGVNFFLSIIALFGFLGLIYGGILYISAGGDAAKAEKAQKNIIWSVTGLIIAAISWAILNYVVKLGR